MPIILYKLLIPGFEHLFGLLQSEGQNNTGFATKLRLHKKQKCITKCREKCHRVAQCTNMHYQKNLIRKQSFCLITFQLNIQLRFAVCPILITFVHAKLALSMINMDQQSNN